MKRNYSDKVIELFSSFPQVKYINSKRISFTYEYRLKLYEAWMAGENIKEVAKDDGLPIELLHRKTFNRIYENFQRYGKPKGGKNKGYYDQKKFESNTKEEIQYLLNTGIFVKIRRGIGFSDSFIKEASLCKDELTIEELLIQKDIDLEIVGYQRIYKLNNLIHGKAFRPTVFDKDTIEELKQSPFINRCTSNQFSLKKEFYNESYLISHINVIDILELFEIRHDLLDTSRIQRIKYNLQNHKPSSSRLNNIDKDLRNRINKKKIKILERKTEENFKAINKSIPKLSNRDRKEVCLWVKNYPFGKLDTIKGVLNKVGISKSNYYSILSDDEYVDREITRETQELKDLQKIKKVINYKNYPKGSRMITMMIKNITGTTMGRKKILRLMKKYDIKTSIRKNKTKSVNTRVRKKPNILNRQFKLSRPMMNLMTDVSYLKIDNKHYYLSAVIDGVTSKIVSLQVSDYQDINLANKTLEELPPAKPGSLVHSDQGTLYMSDYFIDRLKELGYNQSMSRRGNCWDNAPIESFFGHLKDEVNYKNCDSLKELKKKVIEYKKYYNEERPQWNRLKMTPIEYESYLNKLNEEEFNKYYKQEEIKYKKMMKEAAIKAKIRAKDLGALA